MEPLLWAAGALVVLMVAIILYASAQAPGPADVAEEPTYIRLCHMSTPVSYCCARVRYDDWGAPWIKGAPFNGYPWHHDYLLLKNGTLRTAGYPILWKHVSGPEVEFPPPPQDIWA